MTYHVNFKNTCVSMGLPQKRTISRARPTDEQTNQIRETTIKKITFVTTCLNSCKVNNQDLLLFPSPRGLQKIYIELIVS